MKDRGGTSLRKYLNNKGQDGTEFKCLFCGAELVGPTKLRGGGRVSFCGFCAEKLEKKGALRRHKGDTIELMKPLVDVIAEF
jgi:transcription elongation factor Elf1